MRHSFSQRHGLLATGKGLVGIAAEPEHHCGKVPAADARIVPGVDVGQLMVAVGIIGGDPMISMALRGSIVSHEELGGPLPMMCFEEQGWIAGSAGKFETLTAEFVSGGQIAGNHVVGGFTAKGDEQLVLVAQFLAKYTGLGKGLEDVRRGKALGCHHGHAQRSLEMNLLPKAALAIRQGCNQFESLA